MGHHLPWPTFWVHRPPSWIYISRWSLMNCYSWSLDIRHTGWCSQELGWDWSSVALTYLPWLQATILDFHFCMIIHAPLQLRFWRCAIRLVKSLFGNGYHWHWPTFWGHRLPCWIFISRWALMNRGHRLPSWSSATFLFWDLLSAPFSYKKILHQGANQWQMSGNDLRSSYRLVQCTTKHFSHNKAIHCQGISDL